MEDRKKQIPHVITISYISRIPQRNNPSRSVIQSGRTYDLTDLPSRKKAKRNPGKQAYDSEIQP
jgi:hypothetical protein